MRRICCLAVCTVFLVAAPVFCLHPASADSPDTKAVHERGIAVLASSIGSDFSPEDLAELVRQAKFSPVVIDWAWITYHWGKTDFAAVNRFLQLMAFRNVPVAAMYRPRFLWNPTVPTQAAQDGKRAVDHAEICYSIASARRWGISWGEKILDKCPSFREIIIYNPLNRCHCPKCSAARAKGPHSAVMGFLTEAKSAWREKQPGVKLGVVYMCVPEFWEAGLAVVDVAHPFLRVKQDIDAAKDVADIRAVRSIVKEKMGSCLAKVTWGEGDKVSMQKLKTVDDLAAKDGISYFFWTFETLFKSSLYDPKAVAQALSANSRVAGEAADKNSTESNLPGSSPPADGKYTPEQIKSMPVETLVARVADPEPGYHMFSALWALPEKAKISDAQTRRSIISLVTAVIFDESKPFKKRWQCCYVLADIGDEQVVPDLIRVMNDEGSGLSGFAAEALATLYKNTNSTAAHDALLKAAPHNSAVREVLTRRLGEVTPAAERGSATASMGSVDELAPAGPPQPPPGPPRPVAEPLPWPFPGGQEDQRIFNNYQQATDSYIHCGLDFIHPAGTPATAVGEGYVVAIYTNYPDWITHHCFIVTPKKGGNRGWCYTHLDPRTFTFKEGDYIRRGQRLGSLVDFSVGNKPGVDHLHLHYVSFTKDASGKVDVSSVLDPLYFFDWEDTEPPTFGPLRFVSEGTTQQFQADAAGVVTVNGKVEILAAITDSAFPGHMGNLGVPVVMLSISDGTHTMQKLVLDHRGDVGEKKRTKPLYLSHGEKKEFFDPASFPRYQMLRVTKTDGDGKITSRDANKCWDTTARDSVGKPMWPDGRYSVNVYAWDIAGNRGVVGATVQVKNTPGG